MIAIAADIANTTPPAPYEACTHWSTAEPLVASIRCPAAFTNTSISPVPAPMKMNEIHRSSIGTATNRRFPVAWIRSAAATVVLRGRGSSRGATKVITPIATIDMPAK